MWNRREFCATLTGLVACNGAAKDPSKETRVSPPMPPARRNEDPGFQIAEGPAPFVVDGDRLIELREGTIILRDAKLVETGRLPISDVRGFAVLADRSLAVRTGTQLHHVVGTTTRATYDNVVGRVVATDRPDEVWLVRKTGASREQLGAGKLAGLLVPRKAFDLPEGVLAGLATLTDGSLAISSQSAILQLTTTTLKRYAWAGYARHLGTGPDAASVWASEQLTKVALVALTGDAGTATSFALDAGDTIVHLAGHRAHVAAVIAHGEGAGVTYSLVVFSAKGKQWGAPLGGEPGTYHVAVDDQRVVVRTSPSYTLRGWVLATGKPLD